MEPVLYGVHGVYVEMLLVIFFAACVNDCVSVSIYLINWCANWNQMSHVSFYLAKGYITPEKKTGLQIKVQFLFISLTYSKFFCSITSM